MPQRIIARDDRLRFQRFKGITGRHLIADHAVKVILDENIQNNRNSGSVRNQNQIAAIAIRVARRLEHNSLFPCAAAVQARGSAEING